MITKCKGLFETGNVWTALKLMKRRLFNRRPMCRDVTVIGRKRSHQLLPVEFKFELDFELVHLFMGISVKRIDDPASQH